MKPTLFNSMFFFFISTVALLCVCAEGGLTITDYTLVTEGGVSCSGICDFDLIGGGGTQADPFKLSGGGTFVSDGTAGSIKATITGTVGIADGEAFYAMWDFTVDLSGGTGAYYVNGYVTLPVIGDYPFSTDPKTLPVGSQDYEGEFEFVNPTSFSLPSSAFELNVVFEWDAGAGETFTLDIPDNSIDLSVQPEIPEPSTVCLLAAGMIYLGYQRRRTHR